MTVGATQVFKNQRLIGSGLPFDYVEPLSVIHFGKEFASDSTFDGAIRNIIGGIGTYYNFDTTSTTCTLSTGLQNPFCLLCSSSSKQYIDLDGNCVTSCPAGTYTDSLTLSCVPCDPTCATCSGAGYQACITCADDTPLFFRSMCFVTCPVNTQIGVGDVCECDDSCSGCTWNSALKQAQCAGCALSSLYLLPDLSQCVVAGQCPLGYLADASTQACATSCPAGMDKDFMSGKCASYCPPSSSQVGSSHPYKCYPRCPDGYYPSPVTPSATGATSMGCTACPTKCKTCLSATQCLSCVSPYLYHENTYQCELTCLSGFTFSLPNYFCQACREGCTACSPVLALNAIDHTCVEDCPIGTVETSGNCDPVTVADVKILNNTISSGSTITISMKENVVLLGDYFAPSANSIPPTLLWSLTTSNTTLSKIFFTNVDRTSKNLVIPSSNLIPAKSYEVHLKVTDAGGTTADDYITLVTESSITMGTFTISPPTSTGKAFSTEFTFTIADFSATSSLKFDIISFFERVHTINGDSLIERVEALSIILDADQGIYTFIFPATTNTIPRKVEMCAYTDLEQVCIKRNITVSDSGSLPLQKVLIWTADASTITSIDRMLDFIRSITLFYEKDYSSKMTNEYYRGTRLIENLAITKDLVACSRTAECSSAGDCTVTGSSFTCTCDTGYGGYNCFYGKRDYDQIHIRVRDILFNLFAVKITKDNVEKAILILYEVTKVMDFVEYNSISIFRDVLIRILGVSNLRSYHLNYIFNILGETIEFVKRPLTTTWFKSIDQALLLNNLTALTDTTFGMIDGIRSAETYFITDSNFIKVLVIDDLASNLYGTSNSFTVKWQTFGFSLPKALISQMSMISVKMLGYIVNPYSDSQNSGQITSVMTLEIQDSTGTVQITTSPEPILITLPKIAASPAFVPISGLAPYSCQFKTSTNIALVSFSHTGCSFVGESETHIKCSCTHLTQFVGQLNLDNIATVPTSTALYSATASLIADIVPAEVELRSFATTTDTTTTSTITVRNIIYHSINFSKAATSSNRISFRLPNVGIYVAAAIFILYLFIMLLNMGNVKKNALKNFLEKGQSILVLVSLYLFPQLT